MLKIGLTGGIGTGKSTVCKLFESLGIKTFDADIIARQLVEPGMPTLNLLENTFGADIIQADGTLHRAKLRELIFSDQIKKKQLEDIMHPLIYAKIAEETENASGHYCVVAVPLLMETQKTDLFDRILVIDCSKEIQLERVIRRNKLSREQVLAIIDSQISREQRLTLADDVIENSSSLSRLAEQIKRLHNSYILLATARTTSA
ncbi:dephospho-CoA kinase [Methylomonas sp. AM2-LC]|uniref:dephospho-CoA kinase n=1 Tax=Methylomonas sp. AM2-LC TaxID=3153301 RepID=UPI003266EE2B